VLHEPTVMGLELNKDVTKYIILQLELAAFKNIPCPFLQLLTIKFQHKLAFLRCATHKVHSKNYNHIVLVSDYFSQILQHNKVIL
jgi:hypothetical protein